MRHLPLLQETDGPNHAGDAAHDVSAARKAEQQYFVARFVIVDQEAVTGLNAAREPDTCTAADGPIENIPGADAQVVMHNLRDLPAVQKASQRLDRAQQSHHVGFTIRLRPVPCSVAADDDTPRRVSRCRPGGVPAVDQRPTSRRERRQPFQPGAPSHFSDELRCHQADESGGDVFPLPPVPDAVRQQRKHTGKIVPAANRLLHQPQPSAAEKQAHRQGPGQNMGGAAHQPDPRIVVHFARLGRIPEPLPEVDAGPIVAQDSVAVREGDTEETLAERVLEVEHRIYPRALRAVAEGRTSLTFSTDDGPSR